MAAFNTTLRRLACAIALTGFLAGCGDSYSNSATSGGTGNSPPDNNPPEEVVQGVATPSTVSVVTATNAN
jgi:hypothetical protein